MESIEKKTGKSGWLTDDVLVGLAVIAFGVSILAQVPGSYGDVMLFPKIVAYVSLVSGLLIIGLNLRTPYAGPRKGFRNEAMCLGISAFMFAVMASAEYMGFFVGLFVVCFAVNHLIAVFCGERGLKDFARSLALSIVMCGFTFVVFRVLLGILTPEGLLI